MQVLVTETCKVKNGIAPEIMKAIFELKNRSYNLRSTLNQFRKENIKTAHYGLQFVRYLGPNIWKFVLNNIKYSNSLTKFKELIKSWKPEAYPCRLYIYHNTQFFYHSSCNINFYVNFARFKILILLF